MPLVGTPSSSDFKSSGDIDKRFALGFVGGMGSCSRRPSPISAAHAPP